MSDKTYNGWTNYETWSVALIIDNDQGLASMRDEMAKECWETAKEDGLEDDQRDSWSPDAAHLLADRLENWITDSEFTEAFGMQSCGTPTLGGQLLGAALSEVNWREIAEHYIADVDKE